MSWFHRGRHRGRFPDHYRSPEAFQAAQQQTVDLIDLIEKDIRQQLRDARTHMIEKMMLGGA